MLEKQPQNSAASSSQEEILRKNKMGTMPVGKLLLNVSLPIVISMLVQALYNVVDSIFVARLADGEAALAAVGLAFPVQNLMIAVAVGTGVGVNSRLGRRLGEQNIDSANRTATNGVFLAVISAIVFAVLGFFGSGLFMSAFASDESAHIAAMGTDYMRIVTVGSLGAFVAVMFERLLQATGRSVLSMTAQLTGAITNIILDPIMIFGLLGFPAMGVSGAALATVVGQWAGMLVGILCHHFRNHEIRLQLRRFKPSLPTIGHIYQVGAPSIVMQSIGSVMVFCMNILLVAFSTTAVSVFGVYFKLQSFIFMPVFGVNNGMVPIIAFNYGAKKPARIHKVIRLTMIANLCIMLLGTLLFWVAPELLLKLFDAQPSMMEIGTAALRIISLAFPMAAIGITLSGAFQALGQGVYALIMSAVRQLIFLLPIAWILARLFGLPILWLAFPLAEIVCTILGLYLFRRLRQQRLAPLEKEAQRLQSSH